MSPFGAVEAAVQSGDAKAIREAVRACAAEHASAFTALDAWGQVAVAACFEQAFCATLAVTHDEGHAYADAYHAAYEPLVATLPACRTGGADWAVDEAYALHANRDMEGLFLLYDRGWGAWSVVHRLHDEDGDVEIVLLVEDDDWPLVVNEALRIVAALP
jgi:hypothetical protein